MARARDRRAHRLTRGDDAVTLTEKQEELCRESPWHFSDLRAMFINCTL